MGEGNRSKAAIEARAQDLTRLLLVLVRREGRVFVSDAEMKEALEDSDGIASKRDDERAGLYLEVRSRANTEARGG